MSILSLTASLLKVRSEVSSFISLHKYKVNVIPLAGFYLRISMVRAESCLLSFSFVLYLPLQWALLLNVFFVQALETQAIIPLILAQKETRNVQSDQVPVVIFTATYVEFLLAVGVVGLRIRIRIILGSLCRIRIRV